MATGNDSGRAGRPWPGYTARPLEAPRVCDVCGLAITGAEQAEGSRGAVYHAAYCSDVVRHQRARLRAHLGADAESYLSHGLLDWPFPPLSQSDAAALTPLSTAIGPAVGALGPNARAIESYGEAVMVVSTPPGAPVGIALMEQGGGWLTDAAIPPNVRALLLGQGWVYCEAYYPVGSLERAVTATQHAIQYAKQRAAAWNGAAADRLFVSGASAGGFNAVVAALREGVWRVGGYSAACLSLVGAPVPPQPTGQILQQVLGPDNRDWAAHTPYVHLYDAGAHRLVGKLFHSTGDTQIPLAWTVAFVKAANAAGHALTLYVQRGGAHMSVCPGAWQVTDQQLRVLASEAAVAGTVQRRDAQLEQWYTLPQDAGLDAADPVVPVGGRVEMVTEEHNAPSE